MAAMPDAIGVPPLVLARWRADDVDDVLAAVQTSFHDLRR